MAATSRASDGLLTIFVLLLSAVSLIHGQVVKDCSCTPEPGTCCFYEHPNYEGCAYGPYTWSNTRNIGAFANDRFSSARCFNAEARLSEHGSIGGRFPYGFGRQVELAGSQPDFGTFGFHDQATSVEITPNYDKAMVVQHGNPNTFMTRGDRSRVTLADIRAAGLSNDAIDELHVPAGLKVTLFLDDTEGSYQGSCVNLGGRNYCGLQYRYNVVCSDPIVGCYRREVQVQRTFGPGVYQLRDYQLPDLLELSPPYGNWRREFTTWADQVSGFIVHQ